MLDTTLPMTGDGGPGCVLVPPSDGFAGQRRVFYGDVYAQAGNAMGRRNHHHVYVIELSKDVLFETRFRKANPGYVTGKPCVYVGMTGLDPDLRFDKHKAAIQANRYVQKYGLRLLPDLYELYNPLSYAHARELEVELAIDFREAGYGVWQA